MFFDERMGTGSGRSLIETQEKAAAYVAYDPSKRTLLPFGLKDEAGPGSKFDLFREALLEAIPKVWRLRNPANA